MTPFIRNTVRTLTVLATGLALVPGAAVGQTPTRLVVRAVSNDAKIIGSGVGGARITVRHAETGAVLARGTQEGSTGDTRSIVVEPRSRGSTVYDTPGAARFVATLELAEPTPVIVEAEGPLGSSDAPPRTSTSLLMVPGVDVAGEGLVLVLHGFTVEILEAEVSDGGALDVRARVTMLCGCPIEPGGLWDADRITVTARLLGDGGRVVTAPLRFTGETSVFSGSLADVPGGPAEIRVLATDGERANTGMASRNVTIPGR